MAPAVRHHGIRDQLHGPELLVGGGHQGRVPEEHGAAVVVIVRVGRQRQHDAVDLGRRDTHWEAARVRRPPRDVHDPRGDVPV